MFFDSGLKDVNIVVIFTTAENITQIENSSVLICDGTFKSSPSCLEQLLTFQVRLKKFFK